MGWAVLCGSRTGNLAGDHWLPERSVKILVVSWFFPPASTMGAMRLGKLAAYLLAAGHDIRVVTPRDTPYARTLSMDIPADRVVLTPWWDVNRVTASVAWLARRVLRRGGETVTPVIAGNAGAVDGAVSPPAPRPRSRLKASARFCVDLLNWPDSRIGWLPFALLAGRRVAKAWSPDVILASGPPFTTLLAGHLLSRWHRVPWIVEFRDRWGEDPYDPLQGWFLRRAVQTESRLVRSAAALITVSEPWANDYRRKYGKPTWVVYNGFDPKDYGVEPGQGSPDVPQLRIVYTGGIYVGRRDPSALFAALRLMGAAADGVRVEFFGTAVAHVQPLVEEYGVERLVTVHPRVPNTESVAVQKRADVLLIMQWNDPLEQGNVPGKLFEYLAARRPILGLGLETGVPATIIRERGAGVYSNDPAEIARHLGGWLEAKRRDGGIPPLPATVCEGFSRAEQFRTFEEVFSAIAKPGP